VRIDGKDADKFRDQLYEALSDDGHFMTEAYGVAPQQTSDSATNIPAIILSGIHSTHESTKYSTEGQGDDKKDYRQRVESHEFQYSIRDAVTGEELDANVIHQDNPGEKEVDQGILAGVVGDAVKGLVEDLVGVESAHRKVLIRDFVATLRLHPEKRVMGLFEEEGIPELKEGVGFARKGNWAAAIASFQAGAERHPKSEMLHKAYFNLGVAFEYDHDFEKALTSLRLADELAPNEGYAAEIDHCKWFARQYRWQQRYAGFASDVPNSVDK
jgi:TolA-binding protein